MKRWIFSIFVAIAMTISVPASASAFDQNYEINEPLYETAAFTADTADPTDNALDAKPNNDSAMDFGAGGFETLSKWQYGRTVMVAYSDTVAAYKASVLACSNGQSAHQSLPKIPIWI